MKTVKTPNYSAAQEDAIRAAAPLNASKAAGLADSMGKTTRSIIAKAVRMGVEYDRKVATTKTGEPVMKKDTLVFEIAAIVGSNLDGLERLLSPLCSQSATFSSAN